MECQLGVVVVWGYAENKLIGETAQGVEIDGVVVACLGTNFRRHVLLTATI